MKTLLLLSLLLSGCAETVHTVPKFTGWKITADDHGFKRWTYFKNSVYCDDVIQNGYDRSPETRPPGEERKVYATLEDAMLWVEISCGN